MTAHPVSAGDRVTAIRAEIARARASATMIEAMAAVTSIYRHVAALEHAGVLEEFEIAAAVFLNTAAPDAPEVVPNA